VAHSGVVEQTAAKAHPVEVQGAGRLADQWVARILPRVQDGCLCVLCQEWSIIIGVGQTFSRPPLLMHCDSPLRSYCSAGSWEHSNNHRRTSKHMSDMHSVQVKMQGRVLDLFLQVIDRIFSVGSNLLAI